MANDVDGAARCFGCLFRRHTSEVPHLDDLRGSRIFARQGFDGPIEIEQMYGIFEAFDGAVQGGFQGSPLYMSAPFLCAPFARVIHEMWRMMLDAKARK